MSPRHERSAGGPEWLDPHPEAPRHRSDDGTPRATDLGPDAIAILDGRTFMFTDSLGDAPLHSVGGLVHEDTRFVSRWELTLDGHPLSLLRSDAESMVRGIGRLII